MSKLTLVRHGQSTPFEKDPDQLSAAGEAQARKLGQFWTIRNVIFDEVYSGSLLRQKRTAEVVGESYTQAGLPWPGVQLMKEWGEYDASGVMTKLAPELARQDPQFQNLIDTLHRSSNGPERNKHFQKAFEAVMNTWLQGRIETPGVESWVAFRDRVRRGIERIVNGSGSGRQVAAFTSGGPIGVTVQMALAAPDRSALEVNWRVRNCSLTEFVFGRGRFTLDSFNGIPHLEDPTLWTFR